MKKALIVWGGWDGHEPEQVAAIFADALKAYEFSVEISNSMDSLNSSGQLKTLDLIVPIVTMGKITKKPRGENTDKNLTNMRRISGMRAIEWAFNSPSSFIQHVSVDHGSGDISMP